MRESSIMTETGIGRATSRLHECVSVVLDLPQSYFCDRAGGADLVHEMVQNAREVTTDWPSLSKLTMKQHGLLTHRDLRTDGNIYTLRGRDVKYHNLAEEIL